MRYQLIIGLVSCVAAAVITKLPEEEQNVVSSCENLAPVIRKDCGVDAAGADYRLTREKCRAFGCCWDITTYQRFSKNRQYVPLCFYPSNYNIAGGSEETVIVLPVSKKEPKEFQETIYIEEIIVMKKPITSQIQQPTNTLSANLQAPKIIEPTSSKLTNISTNKDTKTPTNPPTNNKPVQHNDLVLSYRKKTCQQISTSNALNSTVKGITMEKMKCDTVNFAEYDASTDKNLMQSSTEGMKILMDKFKEEKKDDPTILAGGFTPIINAHNPTATLMEDKLKKMLIDQKKSSDGCKNLESSFARQRKSSFNKAESSQLAQICGSIPDAAYMTGLMASMNILSADTPSNTWMLPDKKLDIDLLEWKTMEQCIGRKKYLVENFNCYKKSKFIYNQESCFNMGCVYHEADCFFCAEAILNMDDMIMALEATSKTNGECASPEAKRRACPGFDKKSDSLASKMMEMQMLSNPSMGLLIERKNKDKCEKLGCCYEKDEKAMMMQMMMNQNSAPQNSMNPMMAMLGGNSGSSGSSMNQMMAMLGGNSGMNGMGSLGSISSMASNPMNALMMKKFGKEDASSCFAKIDLSSTMTHECMPDVAQLQCGQSNLPTATTTQPWHMVIANPDGTIHCGGVLICSSWILTTASCMKSLEISDTSFPQITVFANVVDASNLSTATELSVRRIVYHQLYDKEAFGRQRLIHDIAAIQINSISNMPICLPLLTDKHPEIDADMFSFGHGRFSTNPADTAGTLKQGEFTVTDVETCSEKYGNIDFSRSICANAKSASGPTMPVCQGDRGGATAIHTSQGWTLSGLISGGPEDCDLTDIPAVFISISKELQWIRETTNNCCRSTLFK